MPKIPLFLPYISDAARRNAAEVLSGTQIAEGPRVEAFEAAFEALYGIRALSVNSGTAALDLAFHLAGVGPGDDVIVPVLGHPANCLPVLHRGARVHFADVRETLTMSAESVHAIALECERLKAIVYVHFGGSSATLRECSEVAHAFGVPLIEDAAQCSPEDTFGIGEYSCFSLQAIKFLTAGDGGMLSCKDVEQHARAKKLRWFGFDRTQPADTRDIEEAGYKYHLNDIAAAIAHGNLESFERDVLEKRKLVARAYQYEKLPLLQYSWLTILVHEKALTVQKVLRDNGIGCGQQHFRLDKLSVFKASYPHAVPNMDRLESQYLMLPFHHGLTGKDVERICGIVRTVLGRPR